MCLIRAIKFVLLLTHVVNYYLILSDSKVLTALTDFENTVNIYN